MVITGSFLIAKEQAASMIKKKPKPLDDLTEDIWIFINEGEGNYSEMIRSKLKENFKIAQIRFNSGIKYGSTVRIYGKCQHNENFSIGLKGKIIPEIDLNFEFRLSCMKCGKNFYTVCPKVFFFLNLISF